MQKALFYYVRALVVPIYSQRVSHLLRVPPSAKACNRNARNLELNPFIFKKKLTFCRLYVGG
eukprot:NODE_458_length_937_cov_42.694820_g320_i2.p2 GENE.NODE_458_length_937_cov_42.694820_g320_i2~~NODE_458_length_937_cov_42.694820_g320_i2.p2  ORF type:complete len:62 (-),score=3.39 NODE_458_length_937_cov_42.694820_g320_i2:8-193(-)